MSGTPAAASALAGLYASMGEAEKAAGVVVKAAEAASRGDHVRECLFCRRVCLRCGWTFVLFRKNRRVLEAIHDTPVRSGRD